nr:MAG TPA: hypothetical protein [Caudoviricetes sp.]
MNEEVLRCIDSMRGEISDTIAYLLTAEDGLRAVEELIRTGGGDGVAHKCVSGYTAGAQDACTNLSLEADRILRRLSAEGD